MNRRELLRLLVNCVWENRIHRKQSLFTSCLIESLSDAVLCFLWGADQVFGTDSRPNQINEVLLRIKKKKK
ncbi:hypothetical protein E2C01_040048 [Portunus trituberculatus]|uniref:Uncharacterized protein n=1 Tax=Portunus trituberculatus TaxID=210409 RepID=A0A5B7FGC9_PORTR|nr:hypothetical protein [Portunus trituberculatus]